jgi:AcrR family transcriptional regulator
MARWEPDTFNRLRVAARELFVEQGYEKTTVAEIAARAGLTERTFFRHFNDKREVLFSGSKELQEMFLTGLRSAPASASPMEAMAAALDAIAPFFSNEQRAFSRERHAIISAHEDLKERELTKLASLADAIAAGLGERDVKAPTAGLTAQLGVGVFHVAFQQWVSDKNKKSLQTLLHEFLDEIKGLVAG